MKQMSVTVTWLSFEVPCSFPWTCSPLTINPLQTIPVDDKQLLDGA